MRNIFDHPAYDAEGPVSLPGGYRRRLILDRRSNGRGQVEGRGTTLQALVFEPMAPEDDGEVGRHLQEYAAGDPQQQEREVMARPHPGSRPRGRVRNASRQPFRESTLPASLYGDPGQSSS
jgi:hypothetical protein